MNPTGERESSLWKRAEPVLAKFGPIGVLALIATLGAENAACDFAFFHEAAAQVVAGATPYDAPSYIYPPLLAFALAPLGALPLKTAALVWQVLTIACLVVGVVRAGQLLRQDGGPRAYLALAGAAVLFLPLSHGVFLGQLGVVLLALHLEALHRLRRGQEVVAGALLGVAAALKLFPAIFLVVLPFASRWKAAGALLGSLALLLACFPSSTSRYLAILLSGEAALPATGGHFVSLPSVAQRLFSTTPFGTAALEWPIGALFGPLFVFMAVMVWLTLVLRKRPPLEVAFGAGVVAMLLASPGVGFYHMDLAAVFTLAAALRTRCVSVGLLSAAVVLLALPEGFGLGSILEPEAGRWFATGWANVLRTPATFGLLLCAVVVWRSSRKDAGTEGTQKSV